MWTPVKFEDGDVHFEAELSLAVEPSRKWRLSVGRSLAPGTTRPGDHVRWCVQFRTAKAGFIDAEYGDCSTVEEGKLAAETAYRRLQGSPGRPLTGDKPTTNTERSKRRMDRLMATEAAAEDLRQRLIGLRHDLTAAGLSDWAGRVEDIARATTLKAVAEYTRRNSEFFARRGPKMLSPDETSQRRQRITELADGIDMLAAVLGREPVTYQQFEEILGELQKVGFYPEGSLVSAVAEAFVPATKTMEGHRNN
jgi:hypothetical protein